MSDALYDLSKSPQDGRMYPPQADNVRRHRNGAGEAIGTRRFSKLHNSFVGRDGAIRIALRNGGTVQLDKPGSNGKLFGEQ